MEFIKVLKEFFSALFTFCPYKTIVINKSFLKREFYHCIKAVQIRRFSWSVFSCIRTEYKDLRSKSPPYLVRIKQNTDQKKLRIYTVFIQCLFCVFKNSVSMRSIKVQAHGGVNFVIMTAPDTCL